MSHGKAKIRDGELSYEIEGTGRPVVLLHAGLLDLRMWDEQFELSAGSYTTSRYDARGHGQSSTPVRDFRHYEDLHDLLTTLGIPRATLVGLSLGARTATDFALAYPQAAEALVLAARLKDVSARRVAIPSTS